MATPTIQNSYVGDGSTVLYSFTFPYIAIPDIVVTIDDVVQVITTEYILANATTIQFLSPPANGAKILIRRSTSTDDVASVFFPGSAIRARDLNDNFVQSLYVAQESTVTSQEATDSSAAAEAAALAAQASAESAAEDAADALDQANAASQSASQAQASASDAQAQASSAAVSAQEAAAAAADASSDAASAIATADGAVVVANAADAKADTAIADSAAAVVTANQSKAESSQALSTANAADTKSDTAISTANSATSTANNALSVANTAEQNSTQAKQDAAAAIEAVSEALLYTLVPDVASIPTSPADGDAVEVIDSTGIESFTPLTGLPSGFVGNNELYVRIVYNSGASSWSFISYNATSPEDRYVTRSGDNMTGDLTLGTDKITLDATDGNITAGTYRGQSGGTNNIVLNATSGNVYFAGFAGINSPGSNDTALLLGNRNTSGNAFELVNNQDGGDGSVLVGIETDGSATFSSTLNVTGGLGTIFTADNSGFASTVLSRWISNINSPGGTVCSINGDGSFNSSGSASFAGALEAASIDGGTY